MKNGLNKEVLIYCLEWEMPFGKYKGRKLCDLPIFYLEWFLREDAFPKGKLGMAMRTVYEVKLNGLEEIFTTLKRSRG
jgi:uncharacterized protein (DUF3820 family)